MKTETSLQILETLDGYRQHYMDPCLWSPFIINVIQTQLSTTADSITPGVAGTYPTFIVNGRWVVKFFGRLFDGLHSWEVERFAAQLLTEHTVFPTPRILAQGELTPEGDNRWPFIIFEYIPGIRIADAIGRFSPSARQTFAYEVGEQVRRLHSITVPEMGRDILPSQREYYRLAAERCTHNHRQWGSLPVHLVDQIPAFLEAASKMLEPCPDHLIHADLTGDHFLGDFQQDTWHTRAIIDFGDAMLGQYDYELVALHLDLFQMDLDMLRAFLAGYGFQPASSFPLIAMRAALLHQFDVLSVIPKSLLHGKHWDSLEDLSIGLWGI